MDHPKLPEAHQVVFDAAMSIVERASISREPILPLHEARRLLRENPDCDLTEWDISEFLVRLAVEYRLAADPAN